MMDAVAHYLIYIRRSYRRADAADVSDETQEAIARSLLPAGATSEVIRDSGGHQSGATAERDGYRELIRRVEAGGIAGVAVYDLSRLARNVRLMANLLHELDRQQIAILAGNLPTTRLDSAVGRFMFHMLVSAAQFQRDLDSERMTAMAAQTFADGRHRGLDPYGYRSERDEDGRRALVVVPEQAAVVRRIWSELPNRSTDDIARALNRDGVPGRRGPWTKDAVKDITRRARLYLGNVVTKRGLEERPGRHEPILTAELYEAGRAALERRQRGAVRRSPRHRVYILSGVLACACGAPMRGETRASRGHEWRYYLCRRCDAPSVPGDAAEADVVARISTMRLPDEAVALARAELRRRLTASAYPDADAQRARLDARLEALGKQHEWGDLTDAAYRAKVGEVRRDIAALPALDRLEVFDRNHRVMGDMAANLERATPAQLRQLVALLVERAVATDRQLVDVAWTGPARPFFETLAMAPPDGLEPPLANADPLAWYAAA